VIPFEKRLPIAFQLLQRQGNDDGINNFIKKVDGAYFMVFTKKSDKMVNALVVSVLGGQRLQSYGRRRLWCLCPLTPGCCWCGMEGFLGGERERELLLAPSWW